MLPVESVPWLWNYGKHSHQQIIDFVKSKTPDRPLGLVISVIEESELKQMIGVVPTEKKMWESAGVKSVLVSMRDHQGKLDDITQALAALKQAKQVHDQGQSVVFHCKAGKSRSALMALTFICWQCTNPETQQKYTMENAMTKLVRERSQVLIQSDLDKQATALILLGLLDIEEVGEEKEAKEPGEDAKEK